MPAAAVSAVDTIKLSADAGGSYRLSYKGFDTVPLAHNAAVGTIKAAIEALPSMRDADGNPITVVVSATFAASGSAGVTIAYTSDKALSTDDVMTFTNLAGTAVHQTTSVRTIEGSEGWNSGGATTFDVSVYAMMYKKVMSSHGHIRIKDVMHGR